jgi:hypothetical protein
MHRTLKELGHPQVQTPIQTDKSTAHALLTNNILLKALKAIDMQIHWLQCRSTQNQHQYYWRPETQNLADYWTKHHPASHHKSFQPLILISASDPMYLNQIDHSKGCTYQVLCKLASYDTKISKIGSKSDHICSPKCIIAQWQGCVRLTQTEKSRQQKDIAKCNSHYHTARCTISKYYY